MTDTYKPSPQFIDVEHVSGVVVSVNMSYIILASENPDRTLQLVLDIPPHADSPFSNVFYCRPIGVTIEQFLGGLPK